MDIAQANDQFGIDGRLKIRAGQGGLPLIEIAHGPARAEISIYAGQVLSYQPQGEPDDLLFVSSHAYFCPGKAIKGGIPVCWPWFGPDPESRGRPEHGLARIREWQLLETEARDDGATRVRLGTTDDAASRALWRHPFALEIEITVGPTLDLALITHNTGDRPMTLTQALHGYFRVGDVRQARVLGLSGHDYIDKVADNSRRSQSGAIDFHGPVNRIYLDTAGELIIDDASLGRRIHIEREGSNSAVVWNPWVEQSCAMADFGDDEYLGMVCVEAANAATDQVEIAPGDMHRLAARYRIQSR